jgi:hypothetical protein
MEQSQFLIDTNVAIDFLGDKLPFQSKKIIMEIIDLIPNLSIISKIEILGFNSSIEVNKILLDFISDSNIYQLNNEVVEKTIELRKRNKIKIPDAIIAATAIVNNLILITRNVTDFKNINDLKYKDSFNLS